jgi:poly(3-hydroxybutyrate) depolymerase
MMQSRLLRAWFRAWTISTLLGLSACVPQDPKTSVPFTITTTGSAGAGGGAGADGGSADVPVTPPDAMSPKPDAAMGTDGNGDGNGNGSGMTSGCGQEPDIEAIGKFVQYHISIDGPDKIRDRIYFVRLPKTYDQATPYRVVYLGTGCGGTTAGDVIQLNKAANEEAILVAPMPLTEFGQCFDERVMSVEYPFFDALHKQIEATLCVDPARQFYAGFSTGARFGNMLGCAFPDVLRAFATVQGVLPPLPACKNHPIANLTLADTLETGNPYQGNVMASQHVLAANKCANPNAVPSSPAPVTAPYDPGTIQACSGSPGLPSCVTYTGCAADYPVVFCTTMSGAHTPCEPWSDFAFWNFFKKF